jgi:2-oxoglutarate-Fe(II)-dependent dioxygenase family protein
MLPENTNNKRWTCGEVSSPAVQQVRERIFVHGFAKATDRQVGLPGDFSERLAETYFNDSVLRSDVPDLPVDRKRARDVIYYERDGSRLHLSENEDILIKNRGDIPGERRHSRVLLLQDDYARAWVTACLSLIPAVSRRDRGTFGVNLFRTYTNVVTRPHKDNEEFIIIYVLKKIGSGAKSYLYSSDNPEKRIFFETLQPGEILIFKDSDFLHGATPLKPPAGQSAQRDALVCTVDYPTTYLDGR